MHVELDTQTKMFCGCAVTKGDEPNLHTCPVCLAHPGALPVVNRRAVEYAARIALALDCTVQPRNIFHRKNYFYPDLPKAYQISQYDEPLATEGSFAYWVDGELLRCRINRVHMEEDAAKLIHAGGETGRIAGSDYSMVDFNRGGTPLIEIVTEPDIPSPEAAREFLQQLRNLVVELGVSECNMEEGQIRWDANISVRPAGQRGAGHAHRAQEHEQLPLPAAGARRGDPAPDRAPRGGREDRPGDASLRPRHGHDDAAAQQGRGARLPLLPGARPGAARHRPGLGRGAARDAAGAAGGARGALHRTYGLSRADATVLGSSGALAGFYEEVVAAGAGAKPAANWTMGEYLAHLNAAGLEAGHGHVTAERLARLVKLVEDGTISTSAAKDVFAKMIEERAEPEAIVEKHGLGQISDTSELEALVAEVVAANPSQVEQYRGGKQQVIGFFVGQVMKASGGRANPQVVNDLLRRALDA